MEAESRKNADLTGGQLAELEFEREERERAKEEAVRAKDRRLREAEGVDNKRAARAISIDAMAEEIEKKGQNPDDALDSMVSPIFSSKDEI